MKIILLFVDILIKNINNFYLIKFLEADIITMIINDGLQIISKIEIRCKATSMTFDANAYKDEYLTDILEKEEFNKILDECAKILGGALEKKRKNDEVNIPKFYIIFSAISVILAIGFIISIIMATNYTTSATFFILISVILISVSSIIIFSLSLLNFLRRINKFKTLEAFIKDDIDDYLAMVNRDLLGKCEFKFIPFRDNMIELVTFIKTAAMIRDELIEGNKANKDEMVESKRGLDESERQNLNLNDESRIGLKIRNSTSRKNIEMTSLINPNQSDQINDSLSVKKKFGGFKVKK